MNWLDVVIIVVAIAGAVVGVKTGLIRALASLIGLFIAVGIGVLSIPFGASILIDLIPDSNAAALVDFFIVAAIVYGLILGVIWMLAKVADKVADRIKLAKIPDRLGGGLFALFQSGVGSFVLQVLIRLFPLPFMEEAVEGSIIMTVTSGLASIAVGLLTP